MMRSDHDARPAAAVRYRLLPYRYQQIALVVLLGVVALGTLVHEVWQLATLEAPLAAQKQSVLNQWFVKKGWGWTGAALLVYCVTSGARTAGWRDGALAGLIRWLVATLYWAVMTQALVGDSLTGRVYRYTGSCALPAVPPEALGTSMAADGASPLEQRMVRDALTCRTQGGTWTGHDVSGHCLLLLHCILVSIEEIQLAARVYRAKCLKDRPVSRDDRVLPPLTTVAGPESGVVDGLLLETEAPQPPTHPGLTRRHSPSSAALAAKAAREGRVLVPDATCAARDELVDLDEIPVHVPHPLDFPMGTLESASLLLLLVLIVVWLTMLAITALFYHTWQEKLTGTLVGVLYWIGAYGCVRL
ncbi:hypothetical protein CXG81DRAFT_23275 [Caulochytrium protostelioides]|uniref:FIT family protein scs3 n=1 Tax=Caulochytrium protostelioides TaxID=1555241 RepID=A0A4P9XG68_9FUNG|nr:hypothetical protein CXG81DRAFT_23275 [Caulochytrium protostelioides]|eukprot:RKP04170.1 hypothetical protein CXG81DRAFT_23275 [Caulochytrium protostelioides]